MIVRRRGLLAVLLTGQTMVSMDGSIVAVAMPNIREDLHSSGALLQLVTGGYIFALAVLVVTGARLGDLYGHRNVFLLGLLGFTATSLACGLAPTGTVLVTARICQGASAAFLLPQVLSLIQLAFQGPERSRALGLYSMVLALGVALGQAAGGVIVTTTGSWRPAFLVNVPVGALLLIAGHRVLAATKPGPSTRLDLPGVALLSSGMAAFVIPLVVGREQGWPAWTWVSVATGSGLLLLFRRHELRTPGPLLDLSVLRVPGVRPTLFAGCAVMGAYTGFLFTLALYLQNVLHFSPLHAGLAFLPYTAGFAATGLGWTRLPRANLPVIGLLTFAVAAPVLTFLARDHWPAATSVPLLLAAGAGHAAAFSPLVDRLSKSVGPDNASAVSALTNTGSLLSNVLAIAVFGGVYLSHPTTLMPATALITALLLTAALAAR